jgi:hypothetical protein
VKEFNTSAEDRSDNLMSIKQTMKDLRRLIANNFTGGKNQLWITLTYRDHIIDPKIATRDYKIFMRRLREMYGKLDYISVIEPTAIGRFHFHVLVKNNHSLFVANKDVEKAWGRGYTKTKRLKCSDKVGNYVIAYLSNLELSISGDDKDKEKSKKYVKGARLYFYPKGIRIYRRSKNIIDPLTLTDKKKNILNQNRILGRKPDFVKETKHQFPNGEVKYITEFYDNVPRIETEECEIYIKDKNL